MKEKLGSFNSFMVCGDRFSYKSLFNKVATSLFFIGECYFNLEDYNNAMKYNEMALEIRERIMNIHTSTTIDSNIALRNIYRKLDNKVEAEKYHQKAFLGIEAYKSRDVHSDFEIRYDQGL